MHLVEPPRFIALACEQTGNPHRLEWGGAGDVPDSWFCYGPDERSPTQVAQVFIYRRALVIHHGHRRFVWRREG